KLPPPPAHDLTCAPPSGSGRLIFQFVYIIKSYADFKDRNVVLVYDHSAKKARSGSTLQEREEGGFISAGAP
ncbi:MAG: hypothetical protein PHW17_09475, partial [Desulfobacterales bacterium]|nr:hypothetical protein [Desulfobacterales bacterium]